MDPVKGCLVAQGKKQTNKERWLSFGHFSPPKQTLLNSTPRITIVLRLDGPAKMVIRDVLILKSHSGVRSAKNAIFTVKTKPSDNKKWGEREKLKKRSEHTRVDRAAKLLLSCGK